jgi:hypothetical protein
VAGGWQAVIVAAIAALERIARDLIGVLKDRRARAAASRARRQ